MKLDKTLAFFKRHLPLIISMGIALVFATTHFIIENETFEFGPFSKKGFIHLLDLKALDLKFKSRPTKELPAPRVTIAAIDEKGIERYGLWPWSRATLGEFVRKATQQGAKVIGFDGVFGDEDKNSSYQSIKRFADDYEKAELKPDSKRVRELGDALKEAERRNKEASEALGEADKKLKAKAGPAKGSLAAARKAADEAAKDLAKVKERFGELNRQSTKFYDSMSSEVLSLSPDEAFANAIATSPQTVLGFVWFDREDEVSGVSPAQREAGWKSLEPVVIRNIYEDTEQEVGGNVVQMTQPVPDIQMERMQIHPIVAVLAPLPKLASRAKGFGYFNISPDPDGPIRRIWMLQKHGPDLYPSLSLSVIAKYLGGDIRPLNSPLFPGKRLGGIAIGGSDVVIPTDMHGRLLINYMPTSQLLTYPESERELKNSPEYWFPTYSVADFIDGTVPPDKVKDKIILFGMTAKGWYDLRANPFSAATPGVYIHASVIQSILDGHYLERYYGFILVEILLYLLLGVILGLALPRIPVWGGLIATVAFAVLLYVVDLFFAFSKGTWMLNVLPTAQVALTFVGVTVHGYLTEGKEKRKIRNAFQFYLTRSVVDEVLKDPSKLKLGGERRTCTVLFSDIRGFTTISERLEPVKLIDFLNEYFTPMTNLLFKYDGTLDKYMGDAIMAIFGAPVSYPNHATRACYVALEMMDELHRLQVGWREKGLPEIDIGVGLNTGPMAVGNMGSHIRFSYTVMGDSVNLASRLEGINKQYGTNITISEFTREAAKDDIVAREMDSVRVKGKREPVRIFELLGKGKPNPDQLKLITTFETAIGLYKQQKWDEAIAAFNRVRTELKPNDFASTMYIERCEHMKAEPPGDAWDGVYTMKTK